MFILFTKRLSARPFARPYVPNENLLQLPSLQRNHRNMNRFLSSQRLLKKLVPDRGFAHVRLIRVADNCAFHSIHFDAQTAKKSDCSGHSADTLLCLPRNFHSSSYLRRARNVPCFERHRSLQQCGCFGRRSIRRMPRVPRQGLSRVEGRKVCTSQSSKYLR